MAKARKTQSSEKCEGHEKHLLAGPGATHQTADAAQGFPGTDQSVVVADNQNTRKSGGRGPRLRTAKRVWAREAGLLESGA
jgi:hypothetical protein